MHVHTCTHMCSVALWQAGRGLGPQGRQATHLLSIGRGSVYPGLVADGQDRRGPEPQTPPSRGAVRGLHPAFHPHPPWLELCHPWPGHSPGALRVHTSGQLDALLSLSQLLLFLGSVSLWNSLLQGVRSDRETWLRSQSFHVCWRC